MDIHEAAKALDGCQYRSEGSNVIFKAMHDAGLVAVFGGSDDLIYFAGASVEELGARHDKEYPFTSQGYLKNECVNTACPYFKKIAETAPVVKAKWDEGGFSWRYETAIPHAKFKVMEDDEPYCEGIVFSLSDVKSVA